MTNNDLTVITTNVIESATAEIQLACSREALCACGTNSCSSNLLITHEPGRCPEITGRPGRHMRIEVERGWRCADTRRRRRDRGVHTQHDAAGLGLVAKPWARRAGRNPCRDVRQRLKGHLRPPCWGLRAAALARGGIRGIGRRLGPNSARFE